MSGPGYPYCCHLCSCCFYCLIYLQVHMCSHVPRCNSGRKALAAADPESSQEKEAVPVARLKNSYWLKCLVIQRSFWKRCLLPSADTTLNQWSLHRIDFVYCFSRDLFVLPCCKPELRNRVASCRKQHQMLFTTPYFWDVVAIVDC